ncbi:MAG: TerB family tellurite resistance protein [Rhodobiaceae bacterium]|nr:TerB family tellurite resistance protein [Rhodobiaceae bacterium]MCC0053672.1 TerB family tellurite resistance protein [Rhodobiaceae bacterium]
MTCSDCAGQEDSQPTESQPRSFAERVRGFLQSAQVRLAEVLGGGPAGRQARFSAALVALAAKMAKADGVATQGEFEAFRQVFAFDETQLTRVRALYDLAKKDAAGFDAYARQIARDFEGEDDLLEDVLDGLFHVAKADGAVHEDERLQLEVIAHIFGFSDQAFEAILARHVDDGARDPYRILGVTRDIEDKDLKAHYRRLVADNHPDRMMAHGLPPEMIRIANDRLAAINAAYERIARARNL